MDYPTLASTLRDAISQMNKRLRKQTYSGDSFSITEMTTLSFLYQAPSMTPSELADVNKIKGQSMSQVLARLEKHQLIARTGAGEDKRKVSVTITGKGKEVVERTRYERDEWLAEAIRNQFTEKEAQTLATLIPLLQRIIDAE